MYLGLHVSCREIYVAVKAARRVFQENTIWNKWKQTLLEFCNLIKNGILKMLVQSNLDNRFDIIYKYINAYARKNYLPSSSISVMFQNTERSIKEECFKPSLINENNYEKTMQNEMKQ